MNGIDLVLMVGVGVFAWFGYRYIQRRDRWFEDECARHDRPPAIRELVEERERWASEVEGVPLELLDTLDEIKRLPEVTA